MFNRKDTIIVKGLTEPNHGHSGSSYNAILYGHTHTTYLLIVVYLQVHQFLVWAPRRQMAVVLWRNMPRVVEIEIVIIIIIIVIIVIIIIIVVVVVIIIIFVIIIINIIIVVVVVVVIVIITACINALLYAKAIIHIANMKMILYNYNSLFEINLK